MPLRPAAVGLLAGALLGAAAFAHPSSALAAPPGAVPHQTVPTDKDQCKKDGWAQFTGLGFTGPKDCEDYVKALDKASGGVNLAATPELGGLALFGSGAAGLAGYAWMRIRRRPAVAPQTQ